MSLLICLITASLLFLNNFILATAILAAVLLLQPPPFQIFQKAHITK
jgi:hypothetical protein